MVVSVGFTLGEVLADVQGMCEDLLLARSGRGVDPCGDGSVERR